MRFLLLHAAVILGFEVSRDQTELAVWHASLQSGMQMHVSRHRCARIAGLCGPLEHLLSSWGKFVD